MYKTEWLVAKWNEKMKFDFTSNYQIRIILNIGNASCFQVQLATKLVARILPTVIMFLLPFYGTHAWHWHLEWAFSDHVSHMRV